jgi:ribosomal protein S18 acetylase RimI-like enzyme
MEITVTASIEDATDILNLQKLSYQSEARIYDDFNIPPLMQSLEELQDEFAEKTFLKISSADSIVGSVRALMKTGTCHIERLVVHPAHQGRGLGKALITAVESKFMQADRFELFTGHKSQANMRFYEHLGFKSFKSQSITPGLTLVFLEKRKAASCIDVPDAPRD